MPKFAIKRAQTELVRCLPSVSKLSKIASKREQRQARLPLPNVSDLSNVSGLSNSLTAELQSAGYEVFSESRFTGDGFYESRVLDSEHNQIEVIA